jgi:hypothetical protein
MCFYGIYVASHTKVEATGIGGAMDGKTLMSGRLTGGYGFSQVVKNGMNSFRTTYSHGF